uniref:Uncharacterized protein n=1 Tax=Octactis speculum TaxID=3111310 RepID=A0A7S2F9S2_9STRA
MQNFIIFGFLKDMGLAMMFNIFLYLSEAGDFSGTLGFFLKPLRGPEVDDEKQEDYMTWLTLWIFKFELVLFICQGAFWLWIGKIVYATWFVPEGMGPESTSMITKHMDQLQDMLGQPGAAHEFVAERSASFMHFLWRKGYAREFRDGMKPKARWKNKIDPKIKPDPTKPAPPLTGTTWGDFVNIDQPYELLPNKLKDLSRDSIRDAFRDIEEEPFADRLRLAHKTHESWLKRNTWVYNSKEEGGNPKLTAKFKDLPETEKEKDIVVVNIICAFAMQCILNFESIVKLDENEDKKIHPDEFFFQERLKRFWHNNMRLPYFRGDKVVFYTYDPGQKSRREMQKSKNLGEIVYYRKNVKHMSGDDEASGFETVTMCYIKCEDKIIAVPENEIHLPETDLTSVVELMMFRSSGLFRDDGLACGQDYDEVFGRSVKEFMNPKRTMLQECYYKVQLGYDTTEDAVRFAVNKLKDSMWPGSLTVE